MLTSRLEHRRNRRLVVAAAATVLACGSAMGAPIVYDWHNGGNSNWSTDNNWVGNAAPASNGNTELRFAVPQGSFGGTNTNQNIVDPFRLRGIGFAGDIAVRINGFGLEFDNAAKYINNDGARFHTINAKIKLAGANNLTFAGGGNSDGLVQLAGAISGDPGLTVNHPGNGQIELKAANSFTGGVNLTKGLLRVANADALGTGKLEINGGELSAGTTGSISVGNEYEIKGSFGVGRDTLTSKLRLTGAGKLTGTQTVTVGVASEAIEFAGAMTAPNDSKLIFASPNNALLSPVLERNRRGEMVVRSRAAARMSGESPNFEGAIEASGITLSIDKVLGSNGKPMQGATFGDPNGIKSTAVMAKKAVFFVDNINKQVKTINPNKGAVKTVWQNGNSPGTTTISGGGGFYMDSMTGYNLFIEGATPGDEPGSYSQLVMNDGGAVTLFHDIATQTRPVLYPTVSHYFEPQVDDIYKIIDQTSSSAPRLDLGGNLFQVDPDGGAIVSGGVSPTDLTLADGTMFTYGDGFIWEIRYGLTPGVDPGASSANVNDVFLRVAAVPEPGWCGLVAAAGAGARRRRR